MARAGRRPQEDDDGINRSTIATAVPVGAWTPGNSVGAMYPSVQELHRGFGCLRPACDASEGDSTELLGLGRTAYLLQTLTSDDHPFPEVATAGEPLMSPSTDEFDRAITTLEGHYKSTVNVTAGLHRFRRRRSVQFCCFGERHDTRPTHRDVY
ncbi:hypothetical protein HPB50_020781 [Hyalomma asiaticum]|uniref:Uncharacterized protein n=1 Tax=Hyalomma asiaticum TaxID=266040 RepID=A0ACB7TKK0_HYAAI|nr:hypothetical protein HPB50_020781 [Hyalomma asiaticum]